MQTPLKKISKLLLETTILNFKILCQNVELPVAWLGQKSRKYIGSRNNQPFSLYRRTHGSRFQRMAYLVETKPTFLT